MIEQGTQEQTFLATEGDAFFARSRLARESARAALWPDYAAFLLDLYQVKPRRIVDIGCSGGWQTAALQRRYGAEATGIDPSAEAVAYGTERFPGIRFIRGVASDLAAVPDAHADLAVLWFTCHWWDRATLQRAESEVDRIVTPGGLVLIADFAPESGVQDVPYRHREGVLTYKRRYYQHFVVMWGYRLLAYLEFDHDTRATRVDVPPDERACCALLRKEQ